LRHDNNWDNLPGAKPQAMVYAALVASKTHYFITYSGYHARDWEAICLGLTTVCHEGDMESVTLVVRRDSTGSGFGQPVLLITAAHGRLSAWSNTGDGVNQKQSKVDGAYDFADASGATRSATYADATPHVRIYVQERGHGPIACRAAESPPLLGWFGFLEGVRCEQGAPWDPGFFKGSGLTMRFARGAADAYAPSFDGAKASARYDLISTFDSLWQWRGDIGDHKLLRQSDAMTYAGARGVPFALSQPIGARFDVDQFINDSSTGLLPWADKMTGSQQGDMFLDPAYAFNEAFAFSHAFSLEYDYHPYLPAAVKP
ncbi:MAG: hypothetical protein KC503_00385, partial [Myxococcales bacterium]|nr:hypothetical protein [Myxococcales bacterium]